MDNKEDGNSTHAADRLPALFSLDGSLPNTDGEGIVEDEARGFEADLVLCPVNAILLLIPFELHAYEQCCPYGRLDASKCATAKTDHSPGPGWENAGQRPESRRLCRMHSIRCAAQSADRYWRPGERGGNWRPGRPQRAGERHRPAPMGRPGVYRRACSE